MAPPLRRRFFEEMRVQVHFMYYVVCSLYGCSVLIFNHFPSTSSLPLALSVPHAHNITLGAHTPIFRVPLYATTREWCAVASLIALCFVVGENFS